MGLNHSPKIVTSNLLLSVDIASPRNYSVGGTTAYDPISKLTFNNANTTYTTFSNNSVTFSRSGATNYGGALYVTNAASISTSLAVSNFLYSDHTWEVWFNPITLAGTNINASEQYNGLASYLGFHAGFFYNSTGMVYNIWSGTGSSPTCSSWGNTIIVANTWCQIAVTRTGNVFVPYVNGVPSGTGATQTPSNVGIGTSNQLAIGACAWYNQGITSGGTYAYFSNSMFSNMKMYNKALSANEIKQNFNALRGRYGI